jgi:hypothetical protein
MSWTPPDDEVCKARRRLRQFVLGGEDGHMKNHPSIHPPITHAAMVGELMERASSEEEELGGIGW